MKSGSSIKLLVSDNESDISQQIQQKRGQHQHETHLNHRSDHAHHQDIVQEEYEEDEENIDLLIRQSQKNMKFRMNKDFPQDYNKMEGNDLKKEASFSGSQTQTIPAKNQPQKHEQFNSSEYQFKMQTIKQTMKNLRSLEQHNEPVSSNSLRKGKIIEHSLTKTQTELIIQNIPVYFPYQPYDLQKDYMQAVIKAVSAKSNALLQSPTGTGKTLCLLCSVLSWADHHNSQNTEKVNVIYCSRTHTQLRQVQSELEKTCFRPTMSNFGSRDQFCVKKQFSAIKGRDLMEACSKAVKLYLKSKRKLEMDNEEQGMIRNHIENGENGKEVAHTCFYYKSENEYQRILESYYLNKIVTSEMIKDEGEKHHFCPYYYAFQVKDRADLIFMPYNYLLDVDRLPRYENIIKNSIIILDEAHNVPEAACEGRTFSIYSNIFGNIDAELKKLESHSYMSPQLRQVAYIYESTKKFLQKQYKAFKNKLDLLAENVQNRKNSNNELFNYEDKFDIQQIFKTQDLKIMIYNWFGSQQHDAKSYQALTRARQKQIYFRAATHLGRITKQTDDLIQALKQTYDGIFQNMEKLNSFIQKCLDLISDFSDDDSTGWWKKEANHYRLCVKCIVKEGIFSYEMKLVCLTPSLTFNDIAKYKPRSILLTSGTLSPLDSWQKQLNFPFQVKLMNKHVIQKEQLHLGIVCKSVRNQSTFNFSYNQLQNNQNIYRNLLKTIVHVCSKIRNGILVIFPSYKIISNFKDQMARDPAALSQLQKQKNICFEDKGSVDYIIQNYKNKAKTQKGAVLFCVCRGKVSEGLDFSDQLCRAVIFIGVPYPNIKDPILKEKRDYYDKLSSASKSKGVLCLTGDEWYTLNTMRAVNQGIGRVIRHINDYGMILMLDNRYDQPKLRNMLPHWARASMGTYLNFEQIDEKIGKFYNEMQIKFPSKCMEPQSSEPEQPNIYLRKQYRNRQENKLKSYINKHEQKQPHKQPKQNPLQLMMAQARKSSKLNQRKKSKRKDFDFL